ncbi:hypothetical protein BP6252_01777 [Coleophoma cylindrospora]|uniref:Uncharacterized protein n=1 Tax=Coleophoma cylindrospora TaxID=1849047 RepID=A0A3D8STY3_9HELO|nr:hypothetical protein BP6252_01777 [Coleophoma cylindrospora]
MCAALWAGRRWESQQVVLALMGKDTHEKPRRKWREADLSSRQQRDGSVAQHGAALGRQLEANHVAPVLGHPAVDSSRSASVGCISVALPYLTRTKIWQFHRSALTPALPSGATANFYGKLGRVHNYTKPVLSPSGQLAVTDARVHHHISLRDNRAGHAHHAPANGVNDLLLHCSPSGAAVDAVWMSPRWSAHQPVVRSMSELVAPAVPQESPSGVASNSDDLRTGPTPR